MFNPGSRFHFSIASWQARSAIDLNRVGFLAIALGIILPLFIWNWISAVTQNTREQTEEVRLRYERALPLAHQVMAGNLISHGEAASMSALASVQLIARQAGLEEKLTSIRPARTAQGREGVQIFMESLNLPELLLVIQGFRNQANLEIISGSLNRRMDNPGVMDLNFTMSR